jgi:hypothetical protein
VYLDRAAGFVEVPADPPQDDCGAVVQNSELIDSPAGEGELLAGVTEGGNAPSWRIVNVTALIRAVLGDMEVGHYNGGVLHLNSRACSAPCFPPTRPVIGV